MRTDNLSGAIADLDEKQVFVLIKERLEKGIPSMEIINALQAGMVEVGTRFENGDYFLSELIMCGEIMENSLEILEPHLAGKSIESTKNVVIGTVKGDIHDLGKNIVVMLLKGAGYNVIDLGVDVPKEKFVEAIKKSKAPLVGMSVLLTSCQEAMKEAIYAIRAAGLNSKVIIGGNYIDEIVMEYVGADYFARVASDGLKVAKEVLG